MGVYKVEHQQMLQQQTHLMVQLLSRIVLHKVQLMEEVLGRMAPTLLMQLLLLLPLVEQQLLRKTEAETYQQQRLPNQPLKILIQMRTGLLDIM
jgi:hypothetical protein